MKLSHPRLRPLAAGFVIAGLLVGAFLGALKVPIPAAGNAPLEEILDEVGERMPGWTIVRATETWENNFVVVARCGDREIGFQVAPVRGMLPGDAILIADDRFSHSRLRTVVDNTEYMFWRAGLPVQRPLECREDVAHEVHEASGHLE